MKETRTHTKGAEGVEFDKRFVHVLCPFCGKRAKVETSALAKGARCLCGAVHHADGTTTKGGEK